MNAVEGWLIPNTFVSKPQKQKRPRLKRQSGWLYLELYRPSNATPEGYVVSTTKLRCEMDDRKIYTMIRVFDRNTLKLINDYGMDVTPCKALMYTIDDES